MILDNDNDSDEYDLTNLKSLDVTLGDVSEDILPQGPINDLAGLRLQFPNLVILPFFQMRTIQLAAGTQADMIIPDSALFLIPNSDQQMLFGFDGRGNLPTGVGALVEEKGVMIISPANPWAFYCSGKRSISVRNIGAVQSTISIAYYVPDKLVTV